MAIMVLLRPWRRAQAMELALRVTSWPRMDGKDISMLCRSSSRSRTQLSHTAGEHSGQHRPSAGLPSPLSPGQWEGHTPSHFMLSGPFATRISCLRTQTSHCFPVSPLGHVHSPVRGSQEPPLHSHSAGTSNTESFCAFTTRERGEGVVLFQLCSSTHHSWRCTGPQTAASCLLLSTTGPAAQPCPSAPGWEPTLTCAAALAEAPVAWGTLVAA